MRQCDDPSSRDEQNDNIQNANEVEDTRLLSSREDESPNPLRSQDHLEMDPRAALVGVLPGLFVW